MDEPRPLDARAEPCVSQRRIRVISIPLCVTADDYGLSADINAAIESLAADARLTAVSVMGHRGADLSTARRLADSGISTGAHLCFTGERPITRVFGGRLPSSYRHLFALVTRRPRLRNDLLDEAKAQIAKLRDAGLRIDFINAHEHVHLYPLLWPMIAELARDLRIPIVRAALGQPFAMSLAGALVMASRLSWSMAPQPQMLVLSPLGVGHAGAMTPGLVHSLLTHPFHEVPNVVRELCVHPGLDDSGRRAEYNLIASGELERIVRQRGAKVLSNLAFPR